MTSLRALHLPVLTCLVMLMLTPGGSGSLSGEEASAAAEPADGQPRAVRFRFDVLPTLTRAGCNAGTCHGTPTGKNGFRLSLRGFDPHLDYATLTREADSRRVNRLNPEKSLLLLKATGRVPHLGGKRLDVDDAGYRLLQQWIGSGMPADVGSGEQLASLTMQPSQIVVDAPQNKAQMRVIATFGDGTVEVVTDRSRLTLDRDELATVDASATVHKLQRGEVSVFAEYCGQFATATIQFRETVPEFVWNERPAANPIDELVFARLKQLQIEPSGLSGDAAFLRRVSLDLTGQLPSIEVSRSFLADGAPTKRQRLIDRLLQSPEHADWWAMKWTDRLGCNQRFVGKWGAIKYHAWVRHAMSSNMPEDEFVHTLLTASGPNYTNPPAGFWRRLRVGGIGQNIDPLMAAEEVSQLFLGVRIQCARCHNHPGESWTQDDYYGLASFFARLKFKDGPYVNHRYDKEDTVYPVTAGDVTHPRTGAVAVPRLPNGGEPQISAAVDRREVFADWVVADDNPFFARAAVNRIWYHLMGRGIVEPVDDFRESNPPSHPELLKWLTDEFIRSGYDRRHVIRLIVNSNVYQLSSQPTATNQSDDRYFSKAAVRLLNAEQLLDAVCFATGVPESFPGLPSGTAAMSLPDGEYKHPFLEAFGRPARALACECERETATTFNQALQLVGGAVVHAKLASDAGTVARLAASDLSAEAIAEDLFLRTLVRPPTEQERRVVASMLEGPTASRRQQLEDVLWMLLNHREFLFQH